MSVCVFAFGSVNLKTQSPAICSLSLATTAVSAFSFMHPQSNDKLQDDDEECAYLCACMYSCMPVCLCACVCVCVCVCARARAHALVSLSMYVCLFVCLHLGQSS